MHPDLVSLVERAIRLTPVDFSVHDGLRTLEEQQEYVRRGVSQTINSRHLPGNDGLGHAVDLVPYINGKLRWEWGPIYLVTFTMRRLAVESGVPLIWGGVWDRRLAELSGDLEQHTIAYTRRRQALGLRAFLDGPHFELPRSKDYM